MSKTYPALTDVERNFVRECRSTVGSVARTSAMAIVPSTAMVVWGIQIDVSLLIIAGTAINVGTVVLSVVQSRTWRRTLAGIFDKYERALGMHTFRRRSVAEACELVRSVVSRDAYPESGSIEVGDSGSAPGYVIGPGS